MLIGTAAHADFFDRKGEAEEISSTIARWPGRLPLPLHQLILLGALATHAGLLIWQASVADKFQRGANATVMAVNTIAPAL